MTQVFYRKWRPGDWDEVLGQEYVIATLKNAVRSEHVSHAYLFSGPRGTGKTSTARLLAKAVNCQAEDLTVRPCGECGHCKSVQGGDFLDLIEIDAASNNSVDDIRDLREKINFSPNQGRYKVYIIDEVHMLSTSAFNALLKTLEEPPAHAIFVLATTEAHKVPETVISRCQWHEFRRIPVRVVVDQLQNIADHEDLEAEEDALVLIARQATGSMRDAISLLDQLASTREKITLTLAQKVLGTATDEAVYVMVDALLNQDTQGGLNAIQDTLDKGSDPRQFARQIVGYLRNILLHKMGNIRLYQDLKETREQVERHAGRLTTEVLLSLVQIFNRADKMSQGFWQPSLPLELAFITALDVVDPGKDRKGTPDRPGGSGATSPERLNQTSSKSAVSGQEPSAGEEQPSVIRKSTSFSDQWDQILALVREENHITQALLNSCRPMGIRDGKLVLSFNSSITRSKMIEEGHLEITERIIKQVIGSSLTVECVTGEKSQGGLPPHVEPDGMVATSMRDLGGELVSDDQE